MRAILLSLMPADLPTAMRREVRIRLRLERLPAITSVLWLEVIHIVTSRTGPLLSRRLNPFVYTGKVLRHPTLTTITDLSSFADLAHAYHAFQVSFQQSFSEHL